MDIILEINNTSVSTSYRSIVFVKSKQVAEPIIQNSMISTDQIMIPENNRSHTGLRFKKL